VASVGDQGGVTGGFVGARFVSGGFSTGRLTAVASGLVSAEATALVKVANVGVAAVGTGGGSLGLRSQPTSGTATAANIIGIGVFIDLF
jgi:hypothetical protein